MGLYRFSQKKIDYFFNNIRNHDLYIVDGFKIARIFGFKNTRFFLNLGNPFPQAQVKSPGLEIK